MNGKHDLLHAAVLSDYLQTDGATYDTVTGSRAVENNSLPRCSHIFVCTSW